MPVGESPLPGKVNVYLGNDPKRWQENIPTFGKVRYADVYPGVDLVYYGSDGRLEYDFVVAPGGDPGNIRVAFEGGRPKIDARGDLVFAMGDTEIRLGNLVAYQEKGGQRESVPGRFVLAGDQHARFAVGEYDHDRALVIDPTVIYATYIGGAGGVGPTSVAADSTGSAVITGVADAPGFPVTSGAYQSAFSSADEQCFLAKFTPDGSSLVFATYLGGGQGSTRPDASLLDASVADGGAADAVADAVGADAREVATADSGRPAAAVDGSTPAADSGGADASTRGTLGASSNPSCGCRIPQGNGKDRDFGMSGLGMLGVTALGRRRRAHAASCSGTQI